MWKQRLEGTMTTFAAITSLVVWFLVGTCRSKHLNGNVNHDGRHLNMISGAKVNTSSIHAYLNLKTSLLGSGGGQGSSSPGGGQGGTFPGPGNRDDQDLECPTLNVLGDTNGHCNGHYRFTSERLSERPVFKHVSKDRYIYWWKVEEKWYIGRKKMMTNGALFHNSKDGQDTKEPWQAQWHGGIKVNCGCEDDPECEDIPKPPDCENDLIGKICKRTCRRCKGCEDQWTDCPDLAEKGQCKNEKKLMRKNCEKSCGYCQDTLDCLFGCCPNRLESERGVLWNHWADSIKTCYVKIDIEKNWYDANTYCKNITGGSSKWKTGLAAPHKREFLVHLADKYGHENDFTTHNKIFLTPDGKATRKTGPWIGGTDNKTEGTWKWAEPFQDRLFEPDEIPNGKDFADNQGPYGEEDCLEIFNKKGDVNDMDCRMWVLPFICEAVDERGEVDTDEDELFPIEKIRYTPEGRK